MAISPVLAQPTRTFACEDSLRYQQQIRLRMPDDNSAQSLITVFTESDINPVIGVTLPQDTQTLCTVIRESAFGYQITTGEENTIIASDTATQGISIGASEVEIGEFDNQRGVYWVVSESVFTERIDHTYRLSITQAMLDSGIAIEAYLFAVDDSTQLLAAGQPTEITDDVLLLGGFQEWTQASKTTLPMTVGDVELSVLGAAQGVPYGVALRVATGAVAIADGSATVTQNDEGAYQIACDAVALSENGVRITVPDDGTLYQVTALGASAYDPLLAVIEPTSQTGICYDDTPEAANYELALPSVIIGRNPNTAQALVFGTDEMILGSVDSLGADSVLLIEGVRISEANEVDSYRLYLNTQLALAGRAVTVYAVAADNQIDPQLTLRDATGALMQGFEGADATCDDVGVRSLCAGGADVGDLKGAVLQLSDERAVPLFATDAVVQIPMSANVRDGFIQMDVTGAEGTTGTYILVIHIIL